MPALVLDDIYGTLKEVGAVIDIVRSSAPNNINAPPSAAPPRPRAGNYCAMQPHPPSKPAEKPQSPAAKSQGGAAVKAAKEDRGAEEAPLAASPPNQQTEPTPAAAAEGGEGMKLQKVIPHGPYIKEGRLTTEWTYKAVLKEVDALLELLSSSASTDLNTPPSSPPPRVRAPRPAETFSGGPVLEVARAQQKPPLKGKLSRLLAEVCGRGGRQSAAQGRKVGSVPGAPVPPRRVGATRSPPGPRAGILVTHIARQEAEFNAKEWSVASGTATQRLRVRASKAQRTGVM